MKITPLRQQDPQQWRQQNEEVLQKVHDDALKGIINGVLNMHELEHTGAWKHSGRLITRTQPLKYIFTTTPPGPLKILDCSKRLYLSTLTS